MYVNYRMVVDFARPNKSNTILVAEDDANSRNCLFTLLFDKAPFDMTGVVTAEVRAIKPSGAVVIDTAHLHLDEEDHLINEIDYLLPSSLTDETGTVTLTITLSDNLGARITSFEFYLKIRNALYNEDDYIDDDDMAGFRDLLNRTRAALARMEVMVQQDALPNPYPIRITVDNVEYEYNGDSLVEILMGEVAYLGSVSGEVEITEDDSAAAIAVAAAEAAAESKEECDGVLADVTDIVNNFESAIPTVTVTKDVEHHQAIITVTDKNGVTSTTIDDGVPGVTPDITVTATTDALSSQTPTVTVTKTGTDEAPSFALAFSGLKGSDGSGSPTWGSIGGTLSNQTDLKNALDAKANTSDIPDDLSDLNDDSSHRLVTDTEKSTWNGKSDFSGSYNDLSNKPSIPADLDDLSDVTLSTPSNGQVLKYDGSKWVNGSGGSAATYLDDLTDVTLTTPTNGDYLKYDGTKWVNGSGGGTATASWGNISGTLSNQTDLKNALDAKADSSAVPSNLSDLSDDSSHRLVTDTEKSTWNAKSTFSGSYNDLTNKPTIPSNLSDLSDDSSHRVVTDTEKSTWNAKSNFSGSYNDLTNKPTIPGDLDDLSDVSFSNLSNGQVLKYNGSGWTNANESGGTTTWGSITGTLSSQTDLQTELNAKYDTNDTAETDIADADYFPFYDSSASAKRKSLWSNIKAKLKTYFDDIYRKEPHNYLVISSLVDNTTLADIAMTVQKNVGGQVTSITANGTTPSNKSVAWGLASYTFTLDAGTYILSGCPSGGSQNTYCLLIYGPSLNALYDVGEGVEFTLDTEQNIHVELIIRSNITVSNKTFTPMIRRSGTSSSFSVGLYDDANLTYRMDGFSTIQTQSNGKVVFDNLNPNYGYDLYWYTFNDIDVDTSAMPYHTHVKRESGTQSGTMKLTYTIANGTDGTTRFTLRIMKAF